MSQSESAARELPIHEQLVRKVKWTTVVQPDEYNVDEQVADTIRIHNRTRENWIQIDVGKFVGLYIAWKRLLEERK